MIEDDIFNALSEARATGQTEITIFQLEEFYSRFQASEHQLRELSSTLDQYRLELSGEAQTKLAQLQSDYRLKTSELEAAHRQQAEQAVKAAQELAVRAEQLQRGEVQLASEQQAVAAANGELSHREQALATATTLIADQTSVLAELNDRARLVREATDARAQVAFMTQARDGLQKRVDDALELARLVLLDGVTPGSELGKALSRLLERPL
jgi:hypothetical protein